MPQEDNNTQLDLSEFKLEPHVREALEIALRVAQGQPLSAANILNSASVVQQRERNSAFSTWQSFFPANTDLHVPADRTISDREATSPPANSFLAESFNVALPFLRENRQFWGRDYITLGLLALGDPSLDQVASVAGRDIQSVRNLWFQFVTTDKTFSSHRPWAEWWKARGLPVPVESANASGSAASQLETRQGAYLLTWDPKRTPPGVLRPVIAQLERGEQVTLQWSAGNHGIQRGDRVFLMRHGDDRPGLIGTGVIVSDIRRGRHWDETMPQDWTSYYANVRWEVLRELPLISLDELAKNTGETKLWTEQGSGLPISEDLAGRLETLWENALRLQMQRDSSPPPSTEEDSSSAPSAPSAPFAGSGGPPSNVVAAQQAPVTTPNPEPSKASSAEETAAQARLPDVWMLSDRPLEDRFTEQDRFQFEDYANALAAILDHEKTETPFTMAINAPWGAGKTTLANMIAEQLRQRPTDRGQAPHIICWFNAWMHDDAPNLATPFIAEVGRTADRHRGRLHRIFHPLPSALLEQRSRNWRLLIVVLLILVPTLLTSYWLGSHLQRVDKAKKDSESAQSTVTVTKDSSGKDLSTSVMKKSPVETPPTAGVDRYLETFQSRMVVLGAFFTAMAGLLGLVAKVFASTPLGGFVQSPDKAAEVGAIASAEKQLRDLISQATWRGNRFVVFVDDIERCKPPRSIDVLDAVNQLMSQKGVVVVFLGDMSAVAASAQLKYKDIADIFVPSAGIAQTGPDRGKEAFGRLYLQKIIQFQFDLPIPPMSRVEEYMRRLTVVPQSEEGDYGRS